MANMIAFGQKQREWLQERDEERVKESAKSHRMTYPTLSGVFMTSRYVNEYTGRTTDDKVFLY